MNVYWYTFGLNLMGLKNSKVTLTEEATGMRERP